jgi:hypothetical protein
MRVVDLSDLSSIARFCEEFSALHGAHEGECEAHDGDGYGPTALTRTGNPSNTGKSMDFNHDHPWGYGGYDSSGRSVLSGSKIFALVMMNHGDL